MNSDQKAYFFVVVTFIIMYCDMFVRVANLVLVFFVGAAA